MHAQQLLITFSLLQFGLETDIQCMVALIVKIIEVFYPKKEGASIKAFSHAKLKTYEGLAYRDDLSR
jgi:hypothetical protein